MQIVIRILLAVIMTSVLQKSHSQPDDYSAEIQEKIALVEDSIIVWGKTYMQVPRKSLTDWMQDTNVPGVSIAVINDYQIEWVKAWGWADIKENIPVTPETVFRTGSINKTINAYAFLKAKQDGIVDFEEDINNILKEWKFPYTRDQPINTYHLLSHTSGIWYHFTSTHDHNLGPFKPTLVKMLDRKKSPQDKSKPYLYCEMDPGLKYVYTNAGISVSQQVLIEATGMEYEDYLRSEVFEPLEMAHSFYVLDDKKYTYASGYRSSGKRVAGKYRPVVEYAPAGLWTTPTDLAKYVIDLQLSYEGKSNKVLSKENVDHIFNYIDQELPRSDMLNAGLGSFIVNKGETKYFFHDGEGAGYTGILMGSFEGGNGAVVLTNGENWGLVHAIVSRIAEVYNWHDYHWKDIESAVKKYQWADYYGDDSEGKPKIEADQLAKYMGKYQCEEYPSNIAEIDTLYGRLRGTFLEGDLLSPLLSPLTPNTFWTESESLYTNTQIIFESNENGEFERFVLKNPDVILHWNKVEK